MDPSLAHTIQRLTVIALPIIVAITFHEAAHGFVADRRGDSTARLMGRLTLNPLAHIDPIGTILVPALLFFTTGSLFGWAKPVPVNFMNLRRPKRDMAWVAAAGPGTNLLLAVASGLLFKVLLWVDPDVLRAALGNQFSAFGPGGSLKAAIMVPIAYMLMASVQMNVVLMLFNLLPIPPLDGGRVAVGLLPGRLSEALGQLEPFGMLIIVVVVFLDPFGFMRGYFWPLISIVTNLILAG